MSVEAAPRPSLWRRTREARVGIAFVLPMLVLFAIFRFGPTIASGLLSLSSYRLSGGSEFIGTENYARLVGDSVFWTSLRVTFVYTIIAVPLTIFLALGTALMLQRIGRARALFRAIFFLPYVTSLVLAGVIWNWIFQVDDGLINGLLQRAGLSQIPFLGDAMLVLPSVATAAAWKGFGYSMLILFAGLQSIPPEYLEAAKIDGATSFQQFRHITLPLLRPIMFFVVVIETISSFQIFDIVYVMTGGGPVRSSYSLVYMLYDQGFKFFDFGYASAIGMVLFAIVLIVSIVQRRYFERGEHERHH